MSIDRRTFLELFGFTALGAMLISPSRANNANSLPFSSAAFPKLEQQTSPILALATSLPNEYDYDTQIEGQIPSQIQGTLYRTAFGLYDRGQWRKRLLLDGDGMIQAFRISKGKVRYQNRLVKTQKYKQEAAANTYLYDTWTTLAPENEIAPESGGQAAVTVFQFNGKLYAFDEEGVPWTLDPATLETIESSRFGLSPEILLDFKAHLKIDGRTKERILFAVSPQTNTYTIVTLNQKNKILNQQEIVLPRVTYMHDYFVTPRYVIFNLHPMTVDVGRIGQRSASFLDAMSWQPEQGNLLLLVDRSGKSKPIELQTEAAWMWHSLNAYEMNDEIIADFVGYDNPDHFVGPDPVLKNIMLGSLSEQKFPGKIRRYVINPQKRSVRQEIVDGGNHDYPFVNQVHSLYPHRFGYFTNGLLATGIKRLDFQTGESQVYSFAEGHYCFEPVFVPSAEFDYTKDASQEPGWLLVQGLTNKQKGFLAIFVADQVSAGPVAMAKLQHHVPYNAHGYWQGLS
jgi:all-trans-8'-apo-beta-carotenal 15,15'-oxygenase